MAAKRRKDGTCVGHDGSPCRRCGAVVVGTVTVGAPTSVAPFTDEELGWLREALEAHHGNLADDLGDGGEHDAEELDRMGALLKRLSAACDAAWKAKQAVTHARVPDGPEWED